MKDEVSGVSGAGEVSEMREVSGACGMTEATPVPHDFLSWYLYWCRPETAPASFHRWAGLGLLSAALQNRVLVARDAVRAGPLSLYIMLVGESGSGKGEAIIKRAVEASSQCRDAINAVVGKTSSAYLLSYLSGGYAKDMQRQLQFCARCWGHCWLVAEELAADMRTGEAAQTFLADLTSMWGKTTYMDGTRGHGLKATANLCLSVLVGTTETWLPTVFPQSAVESGTLPRFLTIVEPSTPIRVMAPTYPSDYAILERYIKDWVVGLSGLGLYTPITLTFTPEADLARIKGVEEIWTHYPEEHFRAFMRRSDEMVRKLAALLTISTWPLTYRQGPQGYTPIIEEPSDPRIPVVAVRRGLALYQEALRGLPHIIKLIKATPWSRETDQVLRILKGRGGTPINPGSA